MREPETLASCVHDQPFFSSLDVFLLTPLIRKSLRELTDICFQTGVIDLVIPLDREEQDKYNLSVVAEDNPENQKDSKFSTATIQVDLIVIES